MVTWRWARGVSLLVFLGLRYAVKLLPGLLSDSTGASCGPPCSGILAARVTHGDSLLGSDFRGRRVLVCAHLVLEQPGYLLGVHAHQPSAAGGDHCRAHEYIVLQDRAVVGGDPDPDPVIAEVGYRHWRVGQLRPLVCLLVAVVRGLLQSAELRTGPVGGAELAEADRDVLRGRPAALGEVPTGSGSLGKGTFVVADRLPAGGGRRVLGVTGRHIRRRQQRVVQRLLR